MNFWLLYIPWRVEWLTSVLSLHFLVGRTSLMLLSYSYYQWSWYFRTIFVFNNLLLLEQCPKIQASLTTWQDGSNAECHQLHHELTSDGRCHFLSMFHTMASLRTRSCHRIHEPCVWAHFFWSCHDGCLLWSEERQRDQAAKTQKKDFRQTVGRVYLIINTFLLWVLILWRSPPPTPPRSSFIGSQEW